MKLTYLALSLVFFIQTSFAGTPMPKLRGLMMRIHTQQELDRDEFMKVMVGMIRSSKNPKDLFLRYVKPAFAKDKKSLRAAQMMLLARKNLPKIKAGSSWLELYWAKEKETIRIDIIDISKHQFKINGLSWVYDPSAPLWMQLDLLQKKQKNASWIYHPLLVPEAHAWAAAVGYAIGGIIIGAIVQFNADDYTSRLGTEEFSAGVLAEELGSTNEISMKCFRESSWDSPDYVMCRTGGHLKYYKRPEAPIGPTSIERRCATQEFPITEITLTYDKEKTNYDKSYILIYYPKDSTTKTLPEAMEIYLIKDGKVAKEGKLLTLFKQSESTKRNLPVIKTTDQVTYTKEVPFESIEIKDRSAASYRIRFVDFEKQLQSSVTSSDGTKRTLLFHHRYQFPDNVSKRLRDLHGKILDEVTTYTDSCLTKEDFDLDEPNTLTEIKEKAEDNNIAEEAKAVQ